MDIVTVIIIAFIGFNLFLVVGIMWLVRKVKLDQKRRQQKIVTLAKVIELKDQTIAETEKTLDKYREILKF